MIISFMQIYDFFSRRKWIKKKKKTEVGFFNQVFHSENKQVCVVMYIVVIVVDLAMGFH